MLNPYTTPQSPVETQSRELTYVGFWARVLAMLIDAIILLAITYPLLFWFYGSEYFLGERFFYGGWDIMLSYVFPAAATILFWKYKSATPGKMVVGAKVVDAVTGSQPSTAQLIGRYFAYIPSTLALGLGFFSIGWNPRKQGWHDRLAKTLVVHA